MIGHEAIGVADPVIPFIDMLKGVEERFPVLIILEDRLLLVASGGHMVDSASVFYAEGAGHRVRIAEKTTKCNKRDLTLRFSSMNSPWNEWLLPVVKLVNDIR